MDTEHTYTVKLNWKTGRRGYLQSPETNHTIEVATPPQFPGGVEGIWSPEHLFTASINSCVMTTFLAIAEMSKLSFTDFTSEAKGVLEKVDGKFMMSKIKIYTTLTIDDDDKIERAERILKKAKDACLISNSIKSTIEYYPEVKVEVVNI